VFSLWVALIQSRYYPLSTYNSPFFPFHLQLYLFFPLYEDKLVKSPRKCTDQEKYGPNFMLSLRLRVLDAKKRSCDRNVLTLWHFESACFSCCLFAHLRLVFAAQRCEILLELVKIWRLFITCTGWLFWMVWVLVYTEMLLRYATLSSRPIWRYTQRKQKLNRNYDLRSLSLSHRFHFFEILSRSFPSSCATTTLRSFRNNI